eukprot:gene43856-58460_t
MLFHSSLRKELSRSFGATLVVLVTIVMTMMLIRTLGLASKGSVNPQEVFLVMAYTVLGYMPTILSLSLFIAIVGTLSRMYRDSEMVIWFSSGRGLMDFVKPLFRFAWPVLILIAVMALVGWPWANSQTIGMRKQYTCNAAMPSSAVMIAPLIKRDSSAASNKSKPSRSSGIPTPRANRIDINAITSPLQRHRLGHLHRARFAHAVNTDLREHPQACHRGDIDNAMLAVWVGFGAHYHALGCLLGDEKRAAQIGIHHVRIIFRGHVNQSLRARDAG